MQIQLKLGWPGGFRRYVAVEGVPRALSFSPGEPVEVSDEEFHGLSRELANGVLEVVDTGEVLEAVNGGNDPRVHEATYPRNDYEIG